MTLVPLTVKLRMQIERETIPSETTIQMEEYMATRKFFGQASGEHIKSVSES